MALSRTWLNVNLLSSYACDGVPWGCGLNWVPTNSYVEALTPSVPILEGL